MGNVKNTARIGRPSRSLDEEIAVLALKLQALRDRKKGEERRDRERNLKVIVALIKDEGLDAVSAEAWKAAMPELHRLLVQKNQAGPQERAQVPQKLQEPQSP